MYARDKRVNIGGWWPPEDVERVDRARQGSYLSRSVFIRKTILERLDELEEAENNGRGVHPTRIHTHNPTPEPTLPAKGDVS